MRAFNQPGRSPVHSLSGMVCSSQTLASQVGLDVLKAGGNAMDAAIATSAMQCVVEPGSTGVGGDCFAMYAPQGKGVPVAFNGSGRAPQAATIEALQAKGVTSLERGSPHSVVVPGAVDAWVQLHQDHGRMPFAELLQPAIDAARNGYPLASRAHFDLSKQRDYLMNFEHARRIYLPQDTVPAVGSVVKLPELADVLEGIARHGRDGFYQGSVAQDMVGELQARGGLHTLADFANVKGDYVTPISTDFRGRTVYECPPNGQGVIALLLLNMMSELPVSSDGPLSLDRIHTELEACRRAYAARAAYLADPEHVAVACDQLLSQDYAQQLCAAIDPKQAATGLPLSAMSPHKDTVYISVVDKDRNVCSFINTLYWGFGSGITTRSGVALTNRGMGFSLDPSQANCIAPNKRPAHTIIPAMAAVDGNIALCFGVMGGEYQAMGHQQFLTRLFDYGCDIQEAMDLPRFMIDPTTGELELEAGIDAAMREQLVARGHKIAAGEFIIGGSQAIAIDWNNGVLTGGSDPRKDGCAIGY